MKQLLHEYGAVLALRQARLVLAASVVSVVGDVVAMVALLLKLHDDGHGPYAVMALLICFAGPLVLTMGVAGAVADTHPPRQVLVGATAIQALGAVGLVFAPSLPWTCLSVFVLQTGFAFASPVWTSVMPLVVGDDLVGTYVSLSHGLRAVASPLGAALAGVLVQEWGSRSALTLNATSFVGLLVAAMALRVDPGRRRPRGRGHGPWSTWLPRDGFAALRAEPLMAALVLGVVPMILTLEAVNAVEVFLVRGVLGATPAQFGYAEAGAGAGVVLGSLVAGAVRRRRRRVQVLLAVLVWVPVLQVVQGLAATLLVYAVAAVAVGVALGLVNALVFALLLAEIREHDRGRVLALVSGLSRTATIGALVLGGVLGTHVGPRTAYVVCGAAGAVVALVALVRVGRAVHRSVDAVSTRR